MTPTQLRAFVAVVRLGSVKSAAADLHVSEAAVSLHVAQLRKELGDKLYQPTGAGLAFTPGGLRLASRAAEMLGLQDRTILEVRQAGGGRRLLRVAASTLFAEHAAPGLIGLFADRAKDLDVELSIHRPAQFETLLRTRAADVVIGPRPPADPTLATTHFLNYQIIAVAHPAHPLAKAQPTGSSLREQTWLLGPTGASQAEVVLPMLHRMNVPEERQQIFQSHAAALQEAKRGKGIALVVSFAAAQDIAAGDLTRLTGNLLQAQGTWNITMLGGGTAPSAAAELARFITTPRATQAMLRGGGTTPGRFKPSIYVTLWH
ncbi:LysR family transcriptional regulator [Amycolatopsis sp. SID8362]|uniref:LysR family transcriptional regulator n=1 Tax=Amycolatopsis sp. SID8362 TaxID=2690346 RepID=UPI0013702A23|nr:LysR family transcriptional regulator [Amycolatopsis sp. SID8362]NBH04302.1 LysR family transcriptional regulator [Amycolatopsis sp. SID8362]NED41001.1 LysR family transcriptional regulator [Amycolatopsis sp. SID8362]